MNYKSIILILNLIFFSVFHIIGKYFSYYKYNIIICAILKLVTVLKMIILKYEIDEKVI